MGFIYILKIIYLYLQYQTTINHEERYPHTVNATAKVANDTNENITLARNTPRAIRCDNRYTCLL